jgi:hypothetical protein
VPGVLYLHAKGHRDKGDGAVSGCEPKITRFLRRLTTPGRQPDSGLGPFRKDHFQEDQVSKVAGIGPLAQGNGKVGLVLLVFHQCLHSRMPSRSGEKTSRPRILKCMVKFSIVYSACISKKRIQNMKHDIKKQSIKVKLSCSKSARAWELASASRSVP